MITEKSTDYSTKARELFNKWKNIQGITTLSENQTLQINHKDNVFIRDGVVCPEIWFSQDIRPLFLLKEAYGGEGDWDLAKDHLLMARRIDKIWERVSDWTKGLFATTRAEIPPFIKDNPETAEYNNEYLKKIAVVNIKKSGGKTSSDIDEIDAYAKFDKERLLEQIELCDPTIIICGYTSYFLETIIDKNYREPYNHQLFYKIELNGHPVLVLDYWHPANHYPDIMNYHGLLGIYQQAIKSL